MSFRPEGATHRKYMSFHPAAMKVSDVTNETLGLEETHSQSFKVG